MGWKQVRQFDPSKMGTKKNFCLQNCRIAFVPEIPPKYIDAKEAMLANKNEGTLHPIETRPTDCAVPVFADTPSINEHVMVWDHDKLYSDGKQANPNGFIWFGWGETLNGVRVVEYVKDPEPVPEPTPEPTPEPEFKVGDVVVPIPNDKGEYYDYDGTRVYRYDDDYTIMQINGDRAVLTATRNGQPEIWCAMNTKDIKELK